MRTKSIAAEHSVMHHSLHSFPVTHTLAAAIGVEDEEEEEEEEEEEDDNDAAVVTTTDQIDNFNLRLNRFVNKKGGNLGKFVNVAFILFKR